MDRGLRNTIIIGILLISISVTCSLVYFPYKKNHDFKQCLENSENIFGRKQKEISSHIDDLEKERVIAQQEADKKLAEFLKHNPEPELKLLPMNTTSKYATYEDLKKSVNWKDNLNVRAEWLSGKYAIFDIVKNIDGQIKNISSDFEKIENEKKLDNETCYKKFKQ